MRRSLYALVAVPALFACANEAPEADSQEQDATRTQYVDIGQYLEGDEYEQWAQIRIGLRDGFDEICGDTFCGGDWTNLYSLGFQCSVSSKIGKVRECLWTFAGSQEQVSAADGKVNSSIAFFECRVRPGGNASQLVAALAGDDPLRAEVPGLGGSIYDQLSDCFDSPTQNPALPEPTEGSYANALDVLEGDAYESFFDVTYALHHGFDDVCGDSFCEGEYTNLQSLKFACSQNAEGQLGECAWVIAGSDSRIKADGFHKVTPAPFVCSIPVQGTATELATALDPSAEGSLFERALPGSAETLNDALGRCL